MHNLAFRGPEHGECLLQRHVEEVLPAQYRRGDAYQDCPEPDCSPLASEGHVGGRDNEGAWIFQPTALRRVSHTSAGMASDGRVLLLVVVELAVIDSRRTENCSMRR